MNNRVRFRVLSRDRFTCQYCGRKAPDVVLHVDHILPRSRGGTDDPANLKTACSDCNLGKSDELNHAQLLDSIDTIERANTERLVRWFAEHVHIGDPYFTRDDLRIGFEEFCYLVCEPLEKPTPGIATGEA
jgi:hypothetical protein